jgi:hypothetical protein
VVGCVCVCVIGERESVCVCGKGRELIGEREGNIGISPSHVR